MGKEKFIKKLTIYGGIIPVIKAMGERDAGRFKVMKENLSKKNIYIINIFVKENFQLEDASFDIFLEDKLIYKGVLEKDERLVDRISRELLAYIECA